MAYQEIIVGRKSNGFRINNRTQLHVSLRRCEYFLCREREKNYVLLHLHGERIKCLLLLLYTFFFMITSDIYLIISNNVNTERIRNFSKCNSKINYNKFR